jgi:hypothetical protein
MLDDCDEGNGKLATALYLANHGAKLDARDKYGRDPSGKRTYSLTNQSLL